MPDQVDIIITTPAFMIFIHDFPDPPNVEFLPKHLRIGPGAIFVDWINFFRLLLRHSQVDGGGDDDDGDDDDGCDDKIIFSLQSPEPTKPPLPPKRGISSNPNLVANNPGWGSESLKLQNWDQSSREAQEKTPNSPSLHIFGSPIVRKGGKHEKLKGVMLDEEEDCNSDTGLSSLNSSSADDQFQLDTLV